MPMSYYDYLKRGEQWHNNQHLPQIREMTIDEIERHDKELLDRFEHLIDNVAEGVISAINYDIKTVVNISFDDGKEIFESAKTREIVSRAIVDRFKDELKTNLSKITVK